jgi:hypothetical protein
MTDFFGYSRTVQPNGQLASSELATLSIGSTGQMALVQQVSAMYGQQVNAKFVIGSPTLYWVTGQPQGTISFGRLVGANGYLADLSALQNTCGQILQLTLGLNGTGACAAQVAASGAINFSGGVPEQVSFSTQAGLLEITEGASIRVASMSQQ